MKKAVSVLVLALLCCVQAVAQHGAGGRGASAITIDGANVSVDYGRPALKGRDMASQLPVGQEWRMGSNAATTLTTDAGLTFGKTAVPKGTYVLKAKRVDTDKWHLLVQSKDGSTVAEVPLTLQKAADSAELFTITLTNKDKAGELSLQWGTLLLSTPFVKG